MSLNHDVVPNPSNGQENETDAGECRNGRPTHDSGDGRDGTDARLPATPLPGDADRTTPESGTGQNGAVNPAAKSEQVSKSHDTGDSRPEQVAHTGEQPQMRPAPKRTAKKPLMARLRKGKNVLVLRTFRELDQVARAWADGHFKVIVLIGNPGLGKTRRFKAVVGQGALYLHGRVTPLQLYIAAYRHRNLLIVIDDVAGLIGDPLGVAVLKDLCQSEAEKTVAWRSSTKVLQDENVPPDFKTTSPVAFITNDWPTFDQKLSALEDRAHLMVFDPRPLEIHLAAATWFEDQEVFDFIGENLYFMPGLSLRTYEQAAEFKAAGFAWQDPLIDPRKGWKRRLVATLKLDQSFSSEEDRVKKFEELGGGSRATYYRHARILAKLPPVPRILLSNARQFGKNGETGK